MGRPYAAVVMAAQHGCTQGGLKSAIKPPPPPHSVRHLRLSSTNSACRKRMAPGNSF